MIGEAADLTYGYDHIGAGRAALREIVAKDRDGSEREVPSVVILGQGALTGDDGAAVLGAGDARSARSPTRSS